MNTLTIPKVKKPRAKPTPRTLSLREYLAGQALCGLLACDNTKGATAAFASEAVRYADMTIAAMKATK